MSRTGQDSAVVETADMRMPAPNARLVALASGLPLAGDAVVADVATGRAELALYLAGKHACARVIAIDRSALAVAIARDLVRNARLCDAVEVRLGDGLQALRPGEADLVVIAGVGSRSIIAMLQAAFEARPAILGRGTASGVAQPVLVLQPMSEAVLLRRWALADARSSGYLFCSERLAKDAGRYYHIYTLWPEICAKAPGHQCVPVSCSVDGLTIGLAPSVVEDLGRHLLAPPDPLLPGYMTWRAERLVNLADALARGGPATGGARAGELRDLAQALRAGAVSLRDALNGVNG